MRCLFLMLFAIIFFHSSYAIFSSAYAAPANLPKTGQTTSYVARDDGALGRGVAWPEERFSYNGNGTVSDNLTGLIWLRDANCTDSLGGIAKTDGSLTWSDALTWSSNLYSGKCGLSDGSRAGDWRLPNIEELDSLVDSEHYDPSIPNGHPFTNVQSDAYWSSSSYKMSTVSAWIVGMNYGYLTFGYLYNPSGQPNRYYVWPVKGGSVDNTPPAEATDFVFPVLGISQNNPLKNTTDPLVDGWSGPRVGQHSAEDGHLGQDYYLASTDSAGKPVFAVANGKVVEVLNGPGKYGWCDGDDHGWGPLVVIEHVLSGGFNVPSLAVKDPGICGTDFKPTVIYSLYGHLSKDSIQDLSVGQKVEKGQRIGTIGKYGTDFLKWSKNHLHFELKDKWAFESEGTWYTNRGNDGTCPLPTTYQCLDRTIKGVGTAYSHELGFAPHRYDPSVFINHNMVPKTLTVAKAGLGSGTIAGDQINCGSNCSEQCPGGSVVTLTPTPASDSFFKGWSVTGTIVSGCASSGVGPCEVRLDSDTVVTGTFSPAVVNPPKISGSIGLKGWHSADVMFVFLKITNTGTGNAENININSFGFKTLAGSGCVTYNTSLSPPTPITLGNLKPGESTIIQLSLNIPSTVLRFSISETGSVEDMLCQGSTYKISQTVFK